MFNLGDYDPVTHGVCDRFFLGVHAQAVLNCLRLSSIGVVKYASRVDSVLIKFDG